MIRSVDFAPLYACNLKCEHCFASNLADSKRKVMEAEDFMKVAIDARKMGAVHFAFQGGEPTLLPNLEELVKAVDPTQAIVSITTNATILDDERIKQLKKIGVDVLTVSLDSSIASEHDTFRGMKGAYEKALKTIDEALACGLSVCINTMVSHQNINEPGFRGLIDYTKKRGIKINVLLPSPVGKWVGNYDAMLTEEDHKILADIMSKNPHIRRDLDANYKKYGCGAVKESVYISAYGDVLPCPYIHASLGNIFDESFEDIVGRGRKLKVFKEYDKICLAEEDMDFIRNHLEPIENYGSKPAPFKLLKKDGS